MDSAAAIAALGALAQAHRLAVFRLLVQAGKDGIRAGVIAETLGIPASSLSHHLSHLRRAGLIQQQRNHRAITYTAEYQAMNALTAYLLESCSGTAAF